MGKSCLGLKKCKNPGNQHVADFLCVELEKCITRNRDNLSFTVRRALKSVQETDDLLCSAEECKKLKGIGSFLGSRLRTCFTRENTKNPGENASIIVETSCTTKVTKVIEENPKSKVPQKFSAKWALLLVLWKFEKSKTSSRIQVERCISSLLLQVRGKAVTPKTMQACIREFECLDIIERELINGDEIIKLTSEGIKLAEKCWNDECMTFFQSPGIPTNLEVDEKAGSENYSSAEMNLKRIQEPCNEDKTPLRKRRKVEVVNVEDTSDFTTDIVKKKRSFRIAEITPEILPSRKIAYEHSPLTEQEWRVVLLVDNREQISKNDKQFFYSMLLENRVEVERRTLPLGDFTWIMRNNRTQEEFVFDYVVERKQIKDFVASIKDGRYAEQKYRLKQCGLPRLIYLVEGSSSQVEDPAMRKAIETAIAETCVINEIKIQHSTDATSSVGFLSTLHQLILSTTIKTNSKSWITRITNDENRIFSVFQNRYSKGQLKTTREIFAAQLKQIRGCSGTKAAAILEKFPTPALLMEAYGLNDEITHNYTANVDRVNLLSSFCASNGMQKFGPKLSKTIADFFLSKYFDLS